MKRSTTCERKIRMLGANELAGITGGGDTTTTAKMESNFKNNASTSSTTSWADLK